MLSSKKNDFSLASDAYRQHFAQINFFSCAMKLNIREWIRESRKECMSLLSAKRYAKRELNVYSKSSSTWNHWHFTLLRLYIEKNIFIELSEWEFRIHIISFEVFWLQRPYLSSLTSHYESHYHIIVRGASLALFEKNILLSSNVYSNIHFLPLLKRQKPRCRVEIILTLSVWIRV